MDWQVAVAVEVIQRVPDRPPGPAGPGGGSGTGSGAGVAAGKSVSTNETSEINATLTATQPRYVDSSSITVSSPTQVWALALAQFSADFWILAADEEGSEKGERFRVRATPPNFLTTQQPKTGKPESVHKRHDTLIASFKK
jgi:hypothetical protein